MDLTTLEEKLGYSFKDKKLLDSALNRKSDNDLVALEYNVESLSYLGDGIIGFLVADELLKLSGGSPTYLSDIRSQLTKNKTFVHIARLLELDKYVIIPKTDEPEKRKYALHGRLASSLEAIAGAIYLDGGVDSARGFVKNFIMCNIAHSLGQLQFETPAKKLLLKAIWEKYNAIPNYKLISVVPVPSSGTNLTVAIYAKGILLARGNGHSRREAISDANENAMKEFGISAW